MSFKVALFLPLLLLLGACTSKQFEINLMPIPELFAEQEESPLDSSKCVAQEELENENRRGVLYVTSREPAGDCQKFPFYTRDNAYVLRLGRATVKLTDEELCISELQGANHSTIQREKLELTIDSVYPLGHIPHSAHPLVPTAQSLNDTESDDSLFLTILRHRIAQSPNKSVTIFTHGYRVDFSYPLLVASQFWYFDGLNETFIAFSWPSTYKRYFSYLRDSEIAITSGRDLRILVEYIVANTEAQEINIIAHSAGTRLAVAAANEIALMNHTLSREEVLEKYRINNIILLSGDANMGQLFGDPNDGALKICKTLILYQSEEDKALKASQKIQKNYRIGQAISSREIRPSDSLLIAGIKELGDRLEIVNATNATGATLGNGHSFFWRSPWVSSDLIMLLRHNRRASKRGLMYNETWGTWEFSDNYPELLQQSLEKK